MNTNKILGYLSIIILIIYSGIGISIKIIGQDNLMIEKLFNGLYAILQLLGIAFLLLTTRIKENHKRKLVRFGDVLFILGVGNLILHFQAIIGYTLIAVGLMLIFIDQIIRQKSITRDLFVERMKLIWYLFFWTGFLFKELHLPGASILVFISVISLWMGISGYLFKNGLPKYLS